jgi:hypothetical protein
MRNGLLAGAVVLSLSFLAGCGDGRATEPVRSGPPPVPRAVSVPALPLDLYTPSPAEQERSDRAQARLEARCLRRYGLRWDGPGAVALETGRRMTLSRRTARLGTVDPVLARRYGYHPPEWSTERPATVRLLDRHAEMESDVEKVLHGTSRVFAGRAVPLRGCRAEAAGRLARGVPPVDRNLPYRLADTAMAAALRDSRLTAVHSNWRVCMARSGSDLGHASPRAAARDPRWRREENPTGQEIATAVADVDCQRRAGYLPALVTLVSGHQRELIGDHAKDLDRLKAAKDTRRRNIADALAPTPRHSTPAP